MKGKEESEKAGLKLNIKKLRSWHPAPSLHVKNRWGNNGNSDRLYFLGLQKSLQMVTATMKLKDTRSLKKSYETPRQHIKKWRHYFANKGPSSQSYGFFNSHVWMWELDHKEGWSPKNWCFWTVVKPLEVPLDCKEIQPVNPKENQSWIFIGSWSWSSNTLATWFEELIHLKRPWCWERLNVGGEGNDRGWGCWIASPTWWTWVWPSSGSWWRKRKPGMLQSMGLQRVRHDWVTEQQHASKQKSRARCLHRQILSGIKGRVNTYSYESIPNSFHQATVTLILKANKDTTKRENYRSLSLMNIGTKSSTKQ